MVSSNELNISDICEANSYLHHLNKFFKPFPTFFGPNMPVWNHSISSHYVDLEKFNSVQPNTHYIVDTVTPFSFCKTNNNYVVNAKQCQGWRPRCDHLHVHGRLGRRMREGRGRSHEVWTRPACGRQVHSPQKQFAAAVRSRADRWHWASLFRLLLSFHVHLPLLFLSLSPGLIYPFHFLYSAPLLE